MDLQYEQVMIAQICEASILFVKEPAIKKKLKLAFGLDDHLAIIRADPKHLKHILINLLSNAVKFTQDGGHVSLEVFTDSNAGLARFVVQDSGIGIMPEEMERLFHPSVALHSVALDSSLNHQHEGSGLGLALVRQLTELHGGSVAVKSEVGKGSVFTVTLPYALDVVAEASTPKPALVREPSRAKPVIYRGKILLAEDNIVNIIAVGDYLQDRGYQLFIAHNGREALQVAQQVHPDIILMDIQMPEIDGLEATRQLRAISDFATTPIIALTALAMPGDRERCLESGASAYLTKPVSLRGLVATIQELLEP